MCRQVVPYAVGEEQVIEQRLEDFAEVRRAYPYSGQEWKGSRRANRRGERKIARRARDVSLVHEVGLTRSPG